MIGNLEKFINLLRHVKELKSYMSLSSARAHRAMILTFAYISTATLLVVVLMYLKEILLPASLQAVLAYIFISSTAAGIEPGTAKAQYLLENSNTEELRFKFPGLFISAAGKAVLLSPILVAVWFLTNSSGLDKSSVILCAPIVLAIGFMTTEMRFVLDINGRYASAIWLKQGSLSIGLLCLAVALVSGQSLLAAIAFSLVMRLIWLMAFLAGGKQYLEAAPAIHKSLLIKCMDGGHWIQLVLTSVLGAVGGSMDRIVALRYLDVSDANGYYITYEILSKFWLVSYLLAPVVFSKRARYKDHSRFVVFAAFVISGIGIVFVATVALVSTFWPQLMAYIANGVKANSGVSLFAGAIVLNSLSMILNADLQGMGRTKAVTTITFLGMLVSGISFYALTSYAALYGLYLAWLIKGAFELALALGFILHLRRQQNGPMPVPSVAVDVSCSNKLKPIKRPNFFVVGAAKAGTSSLGHYLKQHPEVYISPIKEPLYFSKDFYRENFRPEYLMSVGSLDIGEYLENYPLPYKPIAHVYDQAHYLELFREVENEKAIGELSTGYLYSSCAAENIFKFNPSAKIVMVLRQPVERAYSHHQMAVKDFVDFEYDFLRALEHDYATSEKGWGKSHLYIELSLYFDQVRRYLVLFPENQVKIFIYDDLRRDPVKFMEELFEFLEVDVSHASSIDVSERKNVTSHPRYKFSRRFERLLNIFRKYIRVMPDDYRSLIRRLMFTDKRTPKLQRHEFEHAMKYFDEDIKKLSVLIKRDLRCWYHYGS